MRPKLILPLRVGVDLAVYEAVVFLSDGVLCQNQVPLFGGLCDRDSAKKAHHLQWGSQTIGFNLLKIISVVFDSFISEDIIRLT